MNYNKLLFISGVNITKGGPLVIMNEYIKILASENPDYNVVVCINSNFGTILHNQNVSYLKYDYPTKNFLFRLFFEYIHLFFLSIKIKPLGVISFNDITPNMISKFKINYIHSPMSFEKFKFSYFLISPLFFFKIVFFRLIHFFTINFNDVIIVQQNQIKRKISKLYSIKDNKIFVCNPFFSFNDLKDEITYKSENNIFVLFYPSVPRELKNIHLVCDAVMRINLFTKHKIVLKITLDGSENKYARKIRKLYKKYEFINFLGLINRNEVLNQINNCNSVIFASEFETWGLPISEAKFYNKEIFVIDMEYAHETISEYHKVIYFSKNNLVQQLVKRLNGDILYQNENDSISYQNSTFIDIFNKTFNIK
jgi:glycosyltransferase involved in cell wall biosynthesis